MDLGLRDEGEAFLDWLLHATRLTQPRLQVLYDIYGESDSPPWRIEAGSFDFSVLGSRKGLVAGENLRMLIAVIRELSHRAQLDESYVGIRQALEPVWPSQQRTEAGGWHRERPGMYSVAGITESSNENQFTRYSRLQYYLELNPPVAGQ